MLALYNKKIVLNVQNLRKYKYFNTQFVSTCKQLTQSEPTKFSKNGVFRSKGLVQHDQIEIPTLPLPYQLWNQ